MTLTLEAEVGDRIRLGHHPGHTGVIVEECSDDVVLVLWTDGFVTTCRRSSLEVISPAADVPEGRWALRREAWRTADGWDWGWLLTYPYPVAGVRAFEAVESWHHGRAIALEAARDRLPGAVPEETP